MSTIALPGPLDSAPMVAAILELIDRDVRYEVVDNEIRELSPMGAHETDLAATLIRILSSFAWSAQLGRVESEMLFLLIPARNLQRRPDLSFVSFERWPRGRRVPRTPAWDVIPNLAIEIISPTNSAGDVIKKIGEYFESGVERVWVIYPEAESVYDYVSPKSIHVLSRDDTLDGGAVLPGLRLPLRDLFEVHSDSEIEPSA